MSARRLQNSAIFVVFLIAGVIAVTIELNARAVIMLVGLALGLLLTRARWAPHLATITVLTVASLANAGILTFQPVIAPGHADHQHPAHGISIKDSARASSSVTHLPGHVASVTEAPMKHPA